ncbi:MAG: N-6 DNA methylase [Rhizonema sp. PD38]|nr:N-6 DNA methylase [Rhizonema sp. PD38]
MQEYLNKTEHLWAITTNGYRWRLLRDSSLMTRLTYIEFDLEQILNGENFAEFGLLYRLFHRSRLPEHVDDADKCLLEYYHQETLQQGGRVRDRLRDGVEKALIQLGTGFLQHQNNEHLRQKVRSSDEEALKRNYEQKYYRQLLRLIYRLLFLMVAESRNLLLIGEDAEKARIYREYYSIERLRELAERPHWRREGFQDLWQGLRVTFRLFDENWRGEYLELSPLNGDLFGSNTLQELDDCAIDNHDLLIAIRHLSLYQQKGQLRRVNYAALDVEELGSVYESLLDFHPQVIQRQGIYGFDLVLGSDRKTTGSYYTPPQLVQQLIKTALEPVIEEKVRSCASALLDPDALKRNYEQALLSLKVVDPACGSGHFLLAAARRLGKELAKIRTGEAEPGYIPLRQAIRDIIQNCIYGVDINPLAVDLCKVALWIEGFASGMPLNFLDHRIKCGNSLVGVLDISCLEEGIPDEAYKAVTGDDKKLSTQFKKRNQRERDNQGQLSLFENLESDRAQYAESARELGEIAETTPQQVKQKQAQYQQSRENPDWWRDYSACNLWTAAFFMPLTEHNLQLFPTTETLTQLLRGNLSTQRIVDAANKLAEEKHFFHWCVEFPEVFEEGGFDCVLGNPPWERIKLQEKEFFASRSAEIANAVNKAARERLIKELPKRNPELAQAFEDAKHDAEAQSKFIRESERFPLTAVGDINTYAVFAETTRKLISPNGRVGVIVPTGIATDDTCKKFFGDLTQKQNLSSLYDFENREGLFSAIYSRKKFSLLAISGKPIKRGNFAFFLTQPRQLDNQARSFQLSPQDIALLNPNTLTCPVFRTSADAELTKKIYECVPVLENERTGSNPWGISFMAMFHMANDSGLFMTEAGNDLVPLYEAKMFHQFTHRWATYTNSGDIRDLTDVEKGDTSFSVQPRYWVSRVEVKNRLADKWKKDWLLGFRRICRSTDERTAIFSLVSQVGFGDSVFLIASALDHPSLVSCLYACLNSLVFDFVTRQKLGGTNFSFFILKQLPILPPETYTQENIEFITTRVLELVYTAWDMQPFAKDMGCDREPFIWNSNRRALLRAELDAYYAKLYGLTRDELRYILDPADVYGEDFPSETFRVLKNNEIKQFGEYRTRRLVLEAWDKMFGRR